MIFELQLAADQLEKYGIKYKSENPLLRALPGNASLIVGISEDGKPSWVHGLKDADLALYYDVFESNHARIPIVKFATPLFRFQGAKEQSAFVTNLEHTKREELPDVVKDALRHMTFGMPDGSKEKNTRQFVNGQRLAKQVVQKIEQFNTGDEPGLKGLSIFFSSIAAIDPAAFFEQLSELVKKATIEEQISSSLGAEILIGGKKKDGNPTCGCVLLVPENLLQAKVSVFSTELRSKLSDVLDSATDKSRIGVSALSGKRGPIVTDCYQRFVTNGIGQMSLMTLNKAAPCNQRYGKAGAESFPILLEEERRLIDVFRYLNAKDKEGKTWAKMTIDGKRKKGKLVNKNIIVVYDEENPSMDMTDVLGIITDSNEPGEDAASAETQFEDHCQKFFDMLKTNSRIKPDHQLRILAIGTFDEGKAGVKMCRNMALGDFERCAKAWGDAAHAPPVFLMRNPFYSFLRKNSPTIRRPICPTMGDVVSLTGEKYFMDSEKKPAHSHPCSFSDVFDAFCGDVRAAKKIFHTIVSNYFFLWFAISEQWNRYPHVRPQELINAGILLKASKAFAAAKIMLSKINNERNESAMQSPHIMYYVGKKLGLCDKLHTLYHEDVSGGKLPRNLIGISHLKACLMLPRVALNRADQRMTCVYKWAKRQGKGSANAGLVWALMNQLTETEQNYRNHADERLLDVMVDEVGKTHLYAGHHAGYEKRQPSQGKLENVSEEPREKELA